MKKTILISALGLSLMLGACSNQQETAQEQGNDKAQQPATQATAESPAAPPATAPSAATAAKAAAANVQGTVVETMNAAGYTYMLVESAGGRQWVAIPETQVEAGQTVNYRQGMVMSNFESKSLGRVFETIVFSGGLAAVGQSDPHAMLKKAAPSTAASGASFAEAVKAEAGSTPVQPQMESSGGSLAAMTTFVDLDIPKAQGANAKSVGEVFAEREALDGQTIQVRGKVIKFSPMIMGKNWLHIQDGSGDPLQNSHDLVVTTAQSAATDSIVTIEGKVAADKDFGFGYRYDVLVEDATVTEE